MKPGPNPYKTKVAGVATGGEMWGPGLGSAAGERHGGAGRQRPGAGGGGRLCGAQRGGGGGGGRPGPGQTPAGE